MLRRRDSELGCKNKEHLLIQIEGRERRMKTKEWGLIKKLSTVVKTDSVGSKAQSKRLVYAQMDISFEYE